MEAKGALRLSKRKLWLLGSIFALAGALALWNLWDLVCQTQYDARFLQQQFASGVTYEASLRTGVLLRQMGQFLSFFWPAVLAVGIFSTVFHKKGLELLRVVALLFQWALKALRWILTAILACRLIFAAIGYGMGNPDMAIYSIPSLLISEGLLAVGAFFLLMLVIRFFNQAGDVAAGFSYAIIKPEPVAVYDCPLVGAMLMVSAPVLLGCALVQSIAGTAPVLGWLSLCATALSNFLLGLFVHKRIAQMELEAYRFSRRK